MSMPRYRVKVERIVRGNETHIVPVPPPDVNEFYVVGYYGDEAEIEVGGRETDIEMLRRELEDLKRRVSELEKAVMPRATA